MRLMLMKLSPMRSMKDRSKMEFEAVMLKKKEKNYFHTNLQTTPPEPEPKRYARSKLRSYPLHCNQAQSTEE